MQVFLFLDLVNPLKTDSLEPKLHLVIFFQRPLVVLYHLKFLVLINKQRIMSEFNILNNKV